MKKVIRISERELKEMISNSVKRVLSEDVLGDGWRADDYYMQDVGGFHGTEDGDEEEHDLTIVGQNGIDNTVYD